MAATATEKLYYKDQYIRAFDAVVTKCRCDENGKVQSVVLDQTAFYPEGGGQPSDTGKIGTIRVKYVHEDQNTEEIWHDLDWDWFNPVEPELETDNADCDCEDEIATPEPESVNITEGCTVHCELDWERRFDLMQQHLGEHMLSAVFVRDFDARNVAMRMDWGSVSIDLDKPVSTDDLEKAEIAANEAIYQNIKVSILYPDDMEEIRSHSRRGMPKTDKAIRVVKVGDLDYVPCCGVHNATTAEVGLIKILKAEPHKGGTRVHFLCGRQAYRRVAEICTAAERTARELRCQDQEIHERVNALLGELRDTKNHVKALIDAAAERIADELVYSAQQGKGKGDERGELKPITVVHVFPDPISTEEMKAVFTDLTTREGVTALLGGKTEKGAFLIFGCHKNDKSIDVRPAFKTAISLIDGKGGGSAFCAQGYGSDLTHLTEAVSQAGRLMLGE